MIEVAEIAEDRTLRSEAFQQIVSDSGLIALIFEYDDQHVVEMLWRRCGSGPDGRVLRKAENRDGPKAECYTYKSAAVQVPGRYISSKSFSVLILVRSPV